MSEWDNRLLCPDGACVGVIGPDGTCKACGRASPGWGDERQRGLQPPEPTDAGDDDVDDDDDDVDDDGLDRADGALDPTENPGWDDRQLCTDGACIGVIGAEGRCTVCGTAATAPDAASGSS